MHWQRMTDICGEKTTQGDALDYLFCPLILLDRWLIHPTQQLLTQVRLISTKEVGDAQVSG